MSFAIWIGLTAVVFAGVLQGLFAVPMKFARRWSYEHIWLTYSLAGMVLLPWLLTSATVPHAIQVYSLTPTGVLIRIAGFGLCWGIGSALAGLGMRLLGIGLGMAIILGLAASVGSLIPLLILTPQQLHTSQGHTYLVGTAIMLAGIAVCARGNVTRCNPHTGRISESPIVSCGIHCVLPVGAVLVGAEFRICVRRRSCRSGAVSWCQHDVEPGRGYGFGRLRRLHREFDLLRVPVAQE